jgi:GT2 family glycosyltransferase
VFLHADCRLPSGAFDAMIEVLDNGRDAGLFAVDYHVSHPLLRLASRLSSLRVRWTEFGEGALFVRRQRFERLGGFPEWPLFEDVDLLARLRRAGTLGRARGCVLASPRRYQRRGVLRQLLLNALLYGMYHAGVSPRRLRDLYEVAS